MIYIYHHHHITYCNIQVDEIDVTYIYVVYYFTNTVIYFRFLYNKLKK